MENSTFLAMACVCKFKRPVDSGTDLEKPKVTPEIVET